MKKAKELLNELRMARFKSGIQLDKIAADTGVNRSRASKIFSGTTKMPGFNDFTTLLSYFGVNISGGEETQASDAVSVAKRGIPGETIEKINDQIGARMNLVGLAKEVGLPYSFVWRIANGNTPESVKKYAKLLAHFGYELRVLPTNIYANSGDGNEEC